MLSRIVRPVKRRDSSKPQFSQRIPTDVRALAVGRVLPVPLGSETLSVRVTPTMQHVRFSLRTHDPSEAKRRQGQAAASLEEYWTALRRAKPVRLTHMDGPRRGAVPRRPPVLLKAFVAALQDVRRARGGAMLGRRSAKMRHGQVRLAHRHRRDRTVMTTRRPCQGRSARSRVQREWCRAEDRPQAGHAEWAARGCVRTVRRSASGRTSSTTRRTAPRHTRATAGSSTPALAARPPAGRRPVRAHSAAASYASMGGQLHMRLRSP